MDRLFARLRLPDHRIPRLFAEKAQDLTAPFFGHSLAHVCTSRTVPNELTKEQIIFYVEKYKPYDKAGAYAIQEWIGVVGIKSVSGDFYNVMGLPVSRVVRELQKING